MVHLLGAGIAGLRLGRGPAALAVPALCVLSLDFFFGATALHLCGFLDAQFVSDLSL